MTTDERSTTGAGGGGTDGESRRAELVTAHGDAAVVAGALRPDNTDSMATTVEGDSIRTVIERGTTGGLQSTVDDYVVNLAVADAVAAAAREHTTPNHE